MKQHLFNLDVDGQRRIEQIEEFKQSNVINHVVKLAEVINKRIKEAKKDMDSISIGRVLALTELKTEIESKFTA